MRVDGSASVTSTKPAADPEPKRQVAVDERSKESASKNQEAAIVDLKSKETQQAS